MRCICSACNKVSAIDKGRTMTGSRAYRCQSCGTVWHWGTGRTKRSPQRMGDQFATTRRKRPVAP